MREKIRSFQDLEVYQNSYQAMLKVYKEILHKLPEEERYDLKEQLRRSVKAIPRLLAEGYAKRHQKRGFLKYIDDALAESNETVVSLCQVRDLYKTYVSLKLCDELIDMYDKISRQSYNLALAWSKFTDRNQKPITDSSCATATDNRKR